MRSTAKIERAPHGSSKSHSTLLLIVAALTVHCRWEDQIIKEDMAIYTGSTGRRGGRASKATSVSPQNGPSASSSMPGAGSLVPDVGRPMTFAEDMEREVGNENEQGHIEGPTFNLYQASVLPVNIPADSMNGDVDISSLGNIAGTPPMLSALLSVLSPLFNILIYAIGSLPSPPLRDRCTLALSECLCRCPTVCS